MRCTASFFFLILIQIRDHSFENITTKLIASDNNRLKLLLVSKYSTEFINYFLMKIHNLITLTKIRDIIYIMFILNREIGLASPSLDVQHLVFDKSEIVKT